ncbi:MAG: hypothetical protein WA628_12935 [Terriglobales bacterium]
MTPLAKERNPKGGALVVTQLLSAAIVSTLISTLIAVIPVDLVGRGASHLLFVVAVGLLGLLLGLTRSQNWRFSAGFVFVFFLFEPVGRVLLRQGAAPPYLFAALSLALAAAYFFGREGGSGSRNGTG